eukprot:410986-Pyramimonas_sp.AAC.1
MEYVQHVRLTFPGCMFEIVMGVDANVTLPADYEAITGHHVLPAAPSHTPSMTRVILEWFTALGGRALNTFECPGEADLRGEPTCLWTCGRRRVLSRRTQIDFIVVSEGVDGYASPQTFDGKLFGRSDHRPLVSYLRQAAVSQCYSVHGPMAPKCMTGWSPINSDALDAFRKNCCRFRGDCLGALQKHILNEARNTPHTTASQRKHSRAMSINSPVREACAL